MQATESPRICPIFVMCSTLCNSCTSCGLGGCIWGMQFIVMKTGRCSSWLIRYAACSGAAWSHALRRDSLLVLTGER